MDGEQAARIPERGENLQQPFVIQPAVIGGVGLERGKSLRHDLGNPGKDVVVHMLEHAVQGIVRVAAAVRLLQIHGELMGQIASLWAEAGCSTMVVVPAPMPPPAFRLRNRRRRARRPPSG